MVLSQAHYILRHHVNTQFNKIPQLAMGLQRERDGGMIFQGIGWGGGQPLNLRVRPDVKGRTLEPQLPFFPLSSIINFFHKLFESVNALGRARYGN